MLPPRSHELCTPPTHSISFSNCIILQVDWEQVALDAGYKDNKNAKIMWGRLEKKLIDAAAQAAGNDDEDAEESSTTTPATGSKKRKATGTPGAKNSLAKGIIAPRA